MYNPNKYFDGSISSRTQNKFFPLIPSVAKLVELYIQEQDMVSEHEFFGFMNLAENPPETFFTALD